MPATENRCRLLYLQGGNISKAHSGLRPVLRVVLQAASRVVVRMPVRMSDHHSDRIVSRMVVRTVFGSSRMCRPIPACVRAGRRIRVRPWRLCTATMSRMGPGFPERVRAQTSISSSWRTGGSARVVTRAGCALWRCNPLSSTGAQTIHTPAHDCDEHAPVRCKRRCL